MSYNDSTFDSLNVNEPADGDSISTAAPAIRQIKQFLQNEEESSTGFKGMVRSYIEEYFYQHWFDKIYPVGSIIITADKAFNPNNQFNTEYNVSDSITQTWEKLESGNFVRIGDDGNFVEGRDVLDVETIGGAQEVLTELKWGGVYIKDTARSITNYPTDTTKVYTAETGKTYGTITSTNELFPPYITLIFWKRIS